MTKWLLLFVLPIGMVDSPEPPLAPVEPAIITELSPRPVTPIDVAKPLPLSMDRYRWFGIKNYTGSVTWEVSDPTVIDLIEVAVPSIIIGKVEGSDTMTQNAVPAGAVVVTAKAQGLCKLTAYGVVNNKAKKLDSIKLLVGPLPPPPVPPIPVPPIPVPPVPPEPPVPPAPIPDAGLHVLIIEETSQRSKLPAAQAAIFQSKNMANYLNTNCPIDSGGKTHAWRVYDQNVTLVNEQPWVQKLMSRTRASVPWIVISNPGKGSYEGPLPANDTDAIALIQKYSG